MRKIFLQTFILSIMITPFLHANNQWQAALDSMRGKMVLIEYYEGINSRETINARQRVKKNLTGFLVNKDGLIITSSSIFQANLEFSGAASIFSRSQEPADIQVKFDQQDFQPAEFIGKDDDTGLAFIRLTEKKEYPFITFTDVQQVHLGSTIYFIQHLPKSYDFQIILRERQVNAELKKPKISYLCEKDPSPSLSSFGLVLNKSGNPIGLLQGGSTDSRRSDPARQSLAEFILYNRFNELIINPPVFKKKETARKKWLGIYSQPFTAETAEYFNQKGLKGVLVNTIIEDSPAEQAGLKPGDVIVSMDGKDVSAEKDSDLGTFRQLIREKEDPEMVLRILRDGRFLKKKVILGSTPISQFLAEEASNNQLGFSVKELTQDIILAKQLNFDTQGVWVSKVERAGWADVAGLRVGDLILKMNEKTVDSLESMKKRFKTIDDEKPEYLSLFIKRKSDTEFLFIKTNY